MQIYVRMYTSRAVGTSGSFHTQTEMLDIRWLSGEELASIPLHELTSVRALKQRLTRDHGCPPRFRQILLYGGGVLEDDIRFDASVDVQLVCCASVPASQEQVDELVEESKRGLQDDVERILRRPQDPDVTNDVLGRSPPSFASMSDFVEIVRLLLEAHAKMHHQDGFGRRTLWGACEYLRLETARLLLEAGAGKNVRTFRSSLSPLAFASSRGHLEVVKLLLEFVADKNLANDCGYLPVRFALMRGNIGIVRLLTEGCGRTEGSQHLCRQMLSAAILRAATSQWDRLALHVEALPLHATAAVLNPYDYWLPISCTALASLCLSLFCCFKSCAFIQEFVRMRPLQLLQLTYVRHWLVRYLLAAFLKLCRFCWKRNHRDLLWSFLL